MACANFNIIRYLIMIHCYICSRESWTRFWFTKPFLKKDFTYLLLLFNVYFNVNSERTVSYFLIILVSLYANCHSTLHFWFSLIQAVCCLSGGENTCSVRKRLFRELHISLHFIVLEMCPCSGIF